MCANSKCIDLGQCLWTKRGLFPKRDFKQFDWGPPGGKTSGGHLTQLYAAGRQTASDRHLAAHGIVEMKATLLFVHRPLWRPSRVSINLLRKERWKSKREDNWWAALQNSIIKLLSGINTLREIKTGWCMGGKNEDKRTLCTETRWWSELDRYRWRRDGSCGRIVLGRKSCVTCKMMRRSDN